MVRFYLQLFVGKLVLFMLFVLVAHRVSNTYCVVFCLLFFALCICLFTGVTPRHKDRDARLTMLYKIDCELVAISKTDRLDRPTRRLRQSHDNAYQVPHCRIDVRKMSFFPRTVRDWNALPPDKASLDTLEAFKASICVQ